MGTAIIKKARKLKLLVKEVKKIATQSIKWSLSELLPLSLEEHILDNILGNINLMDEEANGFWRFEATEEEKPVLSSLYNHLSQIYSKIRTGLVSYNLEVYSEVTPEVINRLQEILSEFSAVIMGGKEVEFKDGEDH